MPDSATNDYDELPYARLSFSETHPDHLAVIGTMLGLDPAAPHSCRVLELGCGSGDNIAAMASDLPGSSFLGVDLSAVHVATGKQMAREAGLTNLTIEQGDLMDLGDDLGQFDYIIAHGLYSWVPPAVRDGIMALCQRLLAPRGIAYISYNTFPGWYLRKPIRDLMLFHGREQEGTVGKARLARSFTQQLREAAEEGGVFWEMLRRAVPSPVAGDEDGDVGLSPYVHDLLGGVNDPVYFTAFLAHAEGFGLQYLSDANFQEQMRPISPAVLGQLLDGYSNTAAEYEQYRDFATLRAFRRSLLCRESAPLRRALRPTSEAMSVFSLASWARGLSEAAEGAPEGSRTFEARNGSKLTIEHPLSQAAMDHLWSVSPRALPWGELLAAVAERAGEPLGDEDADAIAADLISGFAYSPELVTLYLAAPRFVTEVSGTPRASALARHSASFEHAGVPTALRARLDISDVERFVLRMLDGSTTRETIVSRLAGLVADGSLSMPDLPRTNANLIRHTLGDNVDKTLAAFAAYALLEA